MGLHTIMKIFIFYFIFLLFISVSTIHAKKHRHKFVVLDTPITRLCSNKTILTVNGQFPGPAIHATQGDTIFIDVINRASENITIHWHGVKQPRNPWSDGPEWITQCPIRPGRRFRQKVILSDEIGTLWWHAHSEWSRTTVHGAIIIYPKKKNDYPFPKPHAEIPIILGEWFKDYGEPNVSDSFLVNGQPGDLYPCSKQDTFKMIVDYGKTYLLRMVNSAIDSILFFKIANHSITVVGIDGAYTKPLRSDYISFAPGQTIDVLLEANQPPSHYYMAANAYASAGPYDDTITTAIVQYSGDYAPPSPSPFLPSLPAFNDTLASTNFTDRFRSLANKDHPIDVPLNVTNKFFFTAQLNLKPCLGSSCANRTLNEQLLASLNNMSFVLPKIDILQAYYKDIRGVYGTNFPRDPPLRFNYTADVVPNNLWLPMKATEVTILEYDSIVELVFQSTNVLIGIDHPMHLHGQSFYVVGSGFGNFDQDKDPMNYNLVDPPYLNTITVPKGGWTAIRFRANNPGVWLLHCHIEHHQYWGMLTAFIVKDGKSPDAKMLPPPRDMPKC